MQTEFDTDNYAFVGGGTNEVVKPEYKNGRVYISKTQYFDNEPQTQWEQYIGGHGCTSGSKSTKNSVLRR